MADDISDKVQNAESEQKLVNAPSIKPVKNNILPWYWTAAALVAGILFTNVAYYISPPSFLKNRIEESHKEIRIPDKKISVEERCDSLLASVQYNTKALGEHRKALELHLQSHITPNQDITICSGRKMIECYEDSLGKAVADIGKYTAILSSSASDAERAIAFYELGCVKHNLSLDKDAVNDFDKAIQLKKDYAEAYCNRARSKFFLENYLKEAQADIAEALRLDPNLADAYFWRAAIRSMQGFKKEVMQDFDKAIELKPDFAEAYAGRGLLKSELGLKEDAMKDYDTAIELNPDYGFAYFQRGREKKRLDLLDEAIEDFTRAINIDPYLDLQYSARADAYEAKGEKQLAEKDRDIFYRLSLK